MRSLIHAAAIASALVPAAALAATDTDSKNVAITGNVSPLCVLGEPSTAVVDLGQMAETSGARVGRIRTIGSQSVTLADSFCNFANSAVTVTASALVADNTLPPPTGFSRAINYTATATGWNAAPDATVTTTDDGLGLAAAATGVGGTQPAPKISDIVLALSAFAVPGDKLLISGGYNTTVTITLAPDATLK